MHLMVPCKQSREKDGELVYIVLFKEGEKYNVSSTIAQVAVMLSVIGIEERYANDT